MRTTGLSLVCFPLQIKCQLNRCKQEEWFKHLTPGTPEPESHGLFAQGAGRALRSDIPVFSTFRQPSGSGTLIYISPLFLFEGGFPRKQRGLLDLSLDISLDAK